MLQKAVSQSEDFQAIPGLGKASWANRMAPVGHVLWIWLQDAEPASLYPAFLKNRYIKPHTHKRMAGSL